MYSSCNSWTGHHVYILSIFYCTILYNITLLNKICLYCIDFVYIHFVCILGIFTFFFSFLHWGILVSDVQHIDLCKYCERITIIGLIIIHHHIYLYLYFLFYCIVIHTCTHIPHLPYPLISQWTFGLLPYFWLLLYNVAINVGMQVSFQISIFVSSGP